MANELSQIGNGIAWKRFLLERRLRTREVERHIGNAVPPIFAKGLMDQVKKNLVKADEILDEQPEVEICTTDSS